MIEARRGQIVVIKNPKFSKMEGIVEHVLDDRLKIYFPKECESLAWALSEGDDLLVDVHTRFGVKHMRSMVISAPCENGELVIENARALQVPQKREFVRAAVEFGFFIKKNEKLIRARSVDISAGGIKFIPDENVFAVDDIIDIKFLSEEFGKDINIKAVVIAKLNDKLTAKYTEISEFDRNKIAGFCIKVLDERD